MRTIVCPRVFGLRDMRDLLTRLGVVYKKTTNAGYAGSYRPRDSSASVRLDLSRTEVLSAECASMLDATIAWLHMQQAGRSRPGDLSTSDELYLRPYLRKGSAAPATRGASLMLLGPRAVTLPNLGIRAGHENPNLDAARARIARTVQTLHAELMGGIRLTNAGHRSETQLADWAEEFLTEMLFNVAQHADPWGTDDVVHAFVASRYISQQDMRALGARDGGTEEYQSELDWISRTGDSAIGFVDIAISDLGIGVPESLTAAYIRRNQSEVTSATDQQLTRPVNDDEVLVWALSPFGTRKSIHDFASQREEYSWRGLYRMLRRCTSYDGMLRLTSASGSIAALMNDSGDRIAARPKSTRPLSPVTTVRGVLPVPIRQSSRVKRAVKAQGKELITMFAGVIVSPVGLGNVRIDDEKTLETYVQSLVNIASSEIAKNPDANEPWLVVHGIGALSANGESTNPLGTESTQVCELIAATLFRLILPLFGPTHTLIHTFLPNTESEGVLEALEEYLQSFASKVPSALAGSRMGQVGIAVGSGSDVRWLTSHRPPAGPFNPRNSASRLWLRLIAYLPAVSARHSAQASRLKSELHREAATAFLGSRVAAVLTSPDALQRGAWFWKARQRDGKAIEVVRTRTGKLTTHYLSVLGLCAAYPSFLHGLTSALLAVADIWNIESPDRESPLYVVPDSEPSRFLMYRVQRIFRMSERRRGRSSNTVFAGALRARNFGTDVRRVLVFCDYRHEGSMARSALAEVNSSLPQNEVRALRLFIVVDSASQSGEDPNQRDFESIYRFATFDRLTELAVAPSASSLSVDPITNEPHTMEQTSRTDLLKSLSWRRFGEEPELALTSTRFECGIQQIGGRLATIRWPISENLRLPQIRTSVAKRILDFVSTEADQAVLCVCFRKNSSIRLHIEAILSEIEGGLRKSNGGLVQPIWVAEITSQIFQGRQHLGGFIHQALRFAVKRTGETAQYALPLEDAHDLGGEMPNATHLVYLDNSAVTGRAIQEVLLAVQDLPQHGLPCPHRVLLFPLITRLSPVEEGFLRSVQLRRSSEPTGLVALHPIAVEFASIVQLRVRSYRSCAEVPLYVELQKLLRAAQRDPEAEFRELTKAIERAMQTMAEMTRSEGSALHFGSVLGLVLAPEPTAHRISELVVRLRQQLALAQQGVPCAKEAIAALEELQKLDDTGLVSVLAFEPDLLSTDPLMQELLGPAKRYVLHVAVNSIDKEVLSNALWVLAHMPLGLIQYIRMARQDQLDDEQTQRLLVFLALYALDLEEQLRLQRALEQRRTVEPLPLWLEQRGRALLTFAVANYAGDMVAIETVEDARLAVSQYIVDGRGDHVGELADNWKKARQKLNEVAAPNAGTDPVPYAADLELLRHVDDWVRRISMRAQRGLEILLVPDGKARQQIREERQKAAHLLIDLRHRLEGLPNGATSVSDVGIVWRSLLNNTLSGTTEDLYLSHSLSMAKSSSIQGRPGSRERADGHSTFRLAKVVSPPLYVFFGSLLRTLSEDTDVVLNYSAFNEERPPVQTRRKLLDTLEDRSLVGALWYANLDLPLLWTQQCIDFGTISKLLADNLARYANPSAPVEVSFLVEPGSKPDFLTITISSLKKHRIVPGGGAGCLQMIRYANRNGWSIEHDKATGGESGMYVTELGISVEWLPLRRS